MAQEHRMGTVGRVLIVAASFVIVIAGMRAANSIVVPFLLAAFIAVMFAPPMFWMQRKGVPTTLAVLIVVIIIMAIGFVIVVFIGTSINGFARGLPGYQENLQNQMTVVIDWLEGHGINMSKTFLQGYLNPKVALQIIANTLVGLRGVFTNGFMILLTIIFILLEASSMPSKLRAALGDPEASLSNFSRFFGIFNRYLAIKTGISLLTGIIVTVWLAILGVDFPILWGMLAFLLNFVPTIGSILAAIPAFLMGFIQSGVVLAALILAGYLVVNTILGSFLEPRLMGRGLGLSPLVVFISLVFWGWVLGPVGMLLSVPLTMVVKIALESSSETRGIAILLGSASSGRLPEGK